MTVERGVIDHRLDLLVEKTGGFSTTLSYEDRQRLRAIVRRLHLKHFPGHMINDYECDKVIDVIAPQTSAYLIRKHIFNEGEVARYSK